MGSEWQWLYAIVKPESSNRRKSAVFAVAMGASAASAVAAIMQSIREPRRLPDSLNKRAASAAQHFGLRDVPAFRQCLQHAHGFDIQRIRGLDRHYGHTTDKIWP